MITTDGGRLPRFVASVVAFVLSFAIVSTSRAEDKLRVGKAVPQAFSFALLDVGVRQGFFHAEGLDIDISAFGGGGRLQQALAADGIDMGLDTGPDMAFIAKGSPVMAVAAMAGPPLDTGIAVGAKTSIHDIADLKGRRIAGPPATLIGWLTKEFARTQGWGFDGITLVDTGSVNTSWAMVKTGEVEGLGVDLGSALQAQARGDARLIARFGDWIKDFHNYVIFGTTKDAFFSLDRLAAFLKAAPLDLTTAINLDGGPVASQGIALDGFSRHTCGKWELNVRDGALKLLTPLLRPRARCWEMPIALAVVRR